MPFRIPTYLHMTLLFGLCIIRRPIRVIRFAQARSRSLRSSNTNLLSDVGSNSRVKWSVRSSCCTIVLVGRLSTWLTCQCHKRSHKTPINKMRQWASLVQAIPSKSLDLYQLAQDEV